MSADWRQRFVEDLGRIALDLGTPRALVRVLGWMVVCEPAEQSAQSIQRGLGLSAGSVSSATRTLVGLGYLERITYPGDRHLYYQVRSAGWNRALESRLHTIAQLRELADRALAAAGDHERLQDMRDIYAWFEDNVEDLLAKRRAQDSRRR
jgi:DNA-binding transcriptional regulator GbsR (MarR family)